MYEKGRSRIDEYKLAGLVKAELLAVTTVRLHSDLEKFSKNPSSEIWNNLEISMAAHQVAYQLPRKKNDNIS